MGQLLLFIVVALTVAGIVFGVTVMMSGGDSGLTPVEPDGRALPLPGDRPLGEEDVVRARFDTALRGYRMSQVDQALQRAAYDIGYKGELISVLEAAVTALREGRTADADVLRRAREAAAQPIAEALVEPTEGSYPTDPPFAGFPPAPAGSPGAEAGGPVGPADPRAGAVATSSSPDVGTSAAPSGPAPSGPAPSGPAQATGEHETAAERAESERAESERAERR